MLNARTSDRVSTLASRYARMTPDTLLALTATEATRTTTCDEIRSMAMSLLRQDEHKGFRGLLRKVVG